jgi:signal peptidase I
VETRELAAVAALWKRTGREVTASFGGISMLPSIAPGAPLVIVCRDEAEPGDVIVFLHRGTIVVHRLLERREGWLLTRGDANAIPDQPVPAAEIIGRVVAMRTEDGMKPVPEHGETAQQRTMRQIVSCLMRLTPSLARIAVPLLWQSRRVVHAIARAVAPGSSR